jgi:hypothetical protein
MVNTTAFQVGSKAKTVDTGYTSLYNKLVGKQGDGHQGNIHYHKSLDFSDVGIPTSNDNSTTNKYMRQFHQTRIFVQGFGNMNAHGKSDMNNKEQTYLITANLPESFSYKVGSTWSAPFSSFSGGAMQNALLQFTNKYTSKLPGLQENDLASATNRLSTMKVWTGSEPLSLNLSIPVIDDGHGPSQEQTGVNTNFVEALEFLGSLCLPKTSSRFGFYIPPPSPVNLNVQYKTGSEINLQSTYGRIMVQLGGILLVDHCIITGISVRYPDTKTMIRHYYDPKSMGQVGGTGTDYLAPLLATLDIQVTTVEAMTADYYSNMLWLKTDGDEKDGNHTGMGGMNVNISKIGDAISSVAGTVGGMLGFGNGGKENN